MPVQSLCGSGKCCTHRAVLYRWSKDALTSLNCSQLMMVKERQGWCIPAGQSSGGLPQLEPKVKHNRFEHESERDKKGSGFTPDLSKTASRSKISQPGGVVYDP